MKCRLNGTMTQPRVRRTEFFMFLLIFLVRTAICDDGSYRARRDALSTVEDKETNPKIETRRPAAADSINKTHDDVTSKSSSPDGTDANKTAHTANTSNEQSSEGHTTFNTGALVRGFLVFVGLSILVMAYIVFRSFRLSKTRAQLVRKYGVLTHRQDVEMRPLPLEEEDDEDTTVFDASNVVTTSTQHQNA